VAEYDSAAHRQPHALRLHRAASRFCALMLEVIRNHDCGHSRFLRGVTIAAWGVK
jgi:hypothetical protein